MFNGLKDMGKLMKQAKEMKEKMKKIQDELKDVTVTGSALGNKIVVTITGELVVTNIDIADELYSRQDDLKKGLTQAFNEAAAKSKELAAGRLAEVSQGLNLPGLG
jgi:hypothetical protein